MYPHRIRLRGPWEMKLPGQEPRGIHFPANWIEVRPDGYAGPAVFERRFGYPGRIDGHERVWLVGVGVVGPVEISLQGQPLGVVAADSFAFDVTTRLAERNLMEVRLTLSAERMALWDDIAMEVRATAYLDDVVRRGNAISGRIAGTCDRPLEIYALANGRTHGYCEASAGSTFAIEVPAKIPQLRLELVNVSAVWDAIDIEGGRGRRK